MSANGQSRAQGKSFDKITAALQDHDRIVKPTGDYKALAQCPAHDDNSPSLNLTWTGGDNPSTLIYCFAGCEAGDIMAAIGLRKSDLYDKAGTVSYSYKNPDSGWIDRAVHRDPETKAFTQSIKKKTDKTPLYRRDLLRKARIDRAPVYLAEGEKDADALIYLGHVATTAPMGAANFDKCDVAELKGLTVVAIADKDDAGQAWARQVYHHASSVVAGLTFKWAAAGKDVSDHIAAQLPLTELVDPPEGFPYEGDTPPRQEQPDTHRQLKVTKASEITMEATEWLWEDDQGCWIPMGSLVLLGGRESVGKSTLCAHLIAKTTRGELPGDMLGKPRSVIVSTTEDAWNTTIVPRLTAAGADLDRVLQVTSISPEGLEGVLSLPEDTKRLEELVLEHDVALIVLDPLLTMVNTKLDTHKDAEVRRALEPIVRLAQETGASLIGLIHVNKTNDGDLSNRVMGSKALVAVPRAVLFCAKYQRIEESADWGDPEGMPQFANPSGHQEFIFGQVKNNLAATITSSVKYHMETEIVGHDAKRNKDIRTSRLVTGEVLGKSIEDIVMEQEKRRKSTKTQGTKAVSFLVGYLSGKGEVIREAVFEAAKDAGISRNAVYSGKDELGERLIVRRLNVVPSRTTWALRKEGADEATVEDSCESEPAKALATKVVIDGAARHVAYLRDLAEKPRLVGKRQDMIKTDDPHVIQILCQGCGDPKENSSWKCYMYTDDEEGLSWPLCDECVRGPNPNPRFIWDGNVPKELLYINP